MGLADDIARAEAENACLREEAARLRDAIRATSDAAARDARRRQRTEACASLRRGIHELEEVFEQRTEQLGAAVREHDPRATRLLSPLLFGEAVDALRRLVKW